MQWQWTERELGVEEAFAGLNFEAKTSSWTYSLGSCEGFSVS